MDIYKVLLNVEMIQIRKLGTLIHTHMYIYVHTHILTERYLYLKTTKVLWFIKQPKYYKTSKVVHSRHVQNNLNMSS